MLLETINVDTLRKVNIASNAIDALLDVVLLFAVLRLFDVLKSTQHKLDRWEASYIKPAFNTWRGDEGETQK